MTNNPRNSRGRGVKIEDKSSIAVSHDVRREIMRVQSELQIERGERVPLNDVIQYCVCLHDDRKKQELDGQESDCK